MFEVEIVSFSLRDHAKIWFSSLPRNSFNSWDKCKDAFITKYFSSTKIYAGLNFVMKDQFAGLPSEDAATHLNNFADFV